VSKLRSVVYICCFTAAIRYYGLKDWTGTNAIAGKLKLSEMASKGAMPQNAADLSQLPKALIAE
jgi:hypothetical protein